MQRMILVLTLGCVMGVASARDAGQWETTDPTVREWYQALMQPDNPNASCCGEADAYWADEIHVKNGRTYAVITDDQPDEPRRRPHIDIGTEFEIPNNKLKWDKSESDRTRDSVFGAFRECLLLRPTWRHVISRDRDTRPSETSAPSSPLAGSTFMAGSYRRQLRRTGRSRVARACPHHSIK